MGPVAGPVVAAGVVIEPGLVAGVRDSKLVEESSRFRLAAEIREKAAFVVVRRASIEFVNQRGVEEAWQTVTRGCIIEIRNRYPGLLVQLDGNRLPMGSKQQRFDLCKVQAVVHGDATVYAIGAASLVAKASRDNEMIELAQTYPNYGFERHKGYPTPQHVEALRKYGLTPEHRVRAAKKLLEGKPADPAEEMPVDAERAVGLLRRVRFLVSVGVDVGDWENKFSKDTLGKLDRGWTITPKQMFRVVKVAASAEKRAKAVGVDAPPT